MWWLKGRRIAPLDPTGACVMTVKLNRWSYEHAQKLIRNRQCLLDQRGDWSDHRPSRTAEKRFVEEHGLAEYGKWHLGEDDEIEEHDRRRYKFAYGDFKHVHRCAVLAAEASAARYKYTDIELAAVQLHAMLEELRSGKAPAARDHGHVPRV